MRNGQEMKTRFNKKDSKTDYLIWFDTTEAYNNYENITDILTIFEELFNIICLYQNYH